jgi:hypothetical protein
MTANTVLISPIFNDPQYFTNTGFPLSNGQILTYFAGSSARANTYTTQAGNVLANNPIQLDSNGRNGNTIWLLANTSYKLILEDANNVNIQTVDNVYGVQLANINVLDSWTSTDTANAASANALNYVFKVSQNAYGQANNAYAQANLAYSAANSAQTVANTANVWSSVFKTANQTVANSNLTFDPDLQMPILAGSRYIVDASLMFVSPVGAGGTTNVGGLSVTLGSSATNGIADFIMSADGWANNALFNNRAFSSGAVTGSGTVVVNTANVQSLELVVINLRGCVNCNISSQLGVYWGQSITSTNTITMLKDSYLRFRKT